MNVKKVRSADGTAIAYETTGEGAPLVLVAGALCDRRARASGTPLAALLAHRFSVWSYDRRGRGDSGDTAPYAIEREIEDLAAMIDLAGGSAHVFGNSSGALLAAEAAARGLAIRKLALFDPPFSIDSERVEASQNIALRLERATSEGRPGDAVELFLTEMVRMPPPVVAQMRTAPMWPSLEKLAGTLSYDVRIVGRGPALLGTAPSVRSEVLVLEGGKNPPWMREPLGTLVRALPNAKRQTLEGQGHDVDPKVLAGALDAFLGEGSSAT